MESPNQPSTAHPPHHHSPSLHDRCIPGLPSPAQPPPALLPPAPCHHSQILKEHGLNEKQLENMWLFKASFFKKRVPHFVPKSSQLYKRVRTVFAFFGNLRCPTSGLPLFNERAWQKANNLLQEIALGYASDIPGKIYHRHAIGKDGLPLVDKYGIPMLERVRGTSVGEGIHRIFLKGLRFLHTGPELGDALLTEKRHRYNHRNAERTRPEFPRFFHCDTWLIDKLQILCEYLDLPRPLPAWSNACDFIKTPELTTIGRVHDDALHQAVCALTPSPSVKLTSDQKFLCSRLGTPLPFLPVTTRAERQLFSHLITSYIRTQASPRFDDGACFNSHLMALQFTRMSDGINIFPKLPVYLRQYHTKWLYNRNAASATERVKRSIEELMASLRPQPPVDEAPVVGQVHRVAQCEVQSVEPKKPILHYSDDLVKEYEEMPQPPTVPRASPSQFVRQVAEVQFDVGHRSSSIAPSISKEDLKRACVLCRRAGRPVQECLSCPGQNRNHNRTCPLRHSGTRSSNETSLHPEYQCQARCSMEAAGAPPAGSGEHNQNDAQDEHQCQVRHPGASRGARGTLPAAAPGKKDLKRSCVLCRRAGRPYEECLSCPGRNCNHNRACPLRHSASVAHQSATTQAKSCSAAPTFNTVRVSFEWYPQSNTHCDYMVEATLGLTTLGECVQAFQLATGVHVGRDVHALVDGVHIFAETGHVLQGASGWLEIVEGTIDLRQNSMVHVSIFPRRSGSTNHVTGTPCFSMLLLTLTA